MLSTVSYVARVLCYALCAVLCDPCCCMGSDMHPDVHTKLYGSCRGLGQGVLCAIFRAALCFAPSLSNLSPTVRSEICFSYLFFF